ncbi:MAG: RlmE family RNA methyltransferase [Rhodocyclaceae bacterium]|jgi:23S rRNA (uridine2552-2'-O)-methyltransferase|nr:RlmE family RNA methyltransferase [Rhodocyclaceae bacterium]MBK6906895.1 RlmE family RNA methyltransferase [Rhodocyclaceae bacterium]
MNKPIPGPEKEKKHRHNKGWMQEHVNDTYVQRAKAEGWRSRAAFKLLELDEKSRLIKPGMTVVDLGSAPGSWCQVLSKRLGGKGKIIALDLLPMDPVYCVDFVQGDFRDDAVFAQLESILGGKKADLVLSDMAPNMSGIALSDQARIMHLAELTLDFCARHLKPGGDMLVKVFQGTGFMELRKAVMAAFSEVSVKKPAASRGRSPETYLLARGHNR